MNVRMRSGMAPALAALLLAGLAGLAGCGNRPRPAAGTVAEDSATGAAAADAPADSGAPATGDVASEPFSQPTVVYMEASDSALEVERARETEEDFATMADDLSFYRSSAYEYLQKRMLPVVRLRGRRPLEFVVDGKVRSYDYSNVEHLDVIVLYDGKREPRVIAPIEIQQVDSFFRAAARE